LYQSVDTGVTPTPTQTPTPTPTPTPVQHYDISGNIFVDTNNNGVKDGSETNYVGATVTLSGSNISSQTATSDASGNYTFSQVASGNYNLVLTVPSGYVGTTIGAMSINLNTNITVNFGIVQAFNGSTLFSDDFTGADGTALTTHNSNWVLEDGTMPVIQNNTLAMSSSNSDIGLVNFTKTTDQCSSTDLQFPFTGAIALLRTRSGEDGPGNPFNYQTYINDVGGAHSFAILWNRNHSYNNLTSPIRDFSEHSRAFPADLP